MTRDPLSVLRQLRGTYAGGGDFPPVAQVDKAIAQVEALVESARAGAVFIRGCIPTMPDSYNRELAEKIAASLAFTPAQDSEQQP